MAECELDFTVTRPALYPCALDISSERSGVFPISRVTLRGLLQGYRDICYASDTLKRSFLCDSPVTLSLHAWYLASVLKVQDSK